jgi:hypothetical protein
MERTIYTLKGSAEWCDIHASLRKGEGRFGWSYIESADLPTLQLTTPTRHLQGSR